MLERIKFICWCIRHAHCSWFVYQDRVYCAGCGNIFAFEEKK